MPRSTCEICKQENRIARMEGVVTQLRNEMASHKIETAEIIRAIDENASALVRGLAGELNSFREYIGEQFEILRKVIEK